MSIKMRIFISFVFLMIFAVCGVIIYGFHSRFSDDTSVSIIIGSSVVSGVLSPVFAVSAIRKYLEKGTRSRTADFLNRLLKLK